VEQSYIDMLLEKARKAQRELESYTQGEIDRIVKTIGKTIYDNAEVLAEEAVKESGFGRVDSKTWKQKKTCVAAWRYLRDKKSTGIIEEDFLHEVITYAKPIGVIACVAPSTNPTSTVASNGMSIIKAGNAMIVAPHPRTKGCTQHGVALINAALANIKSPANLIQVIEAPTMALSQELMSKCDVTLATGGVAMVKAAYSSGKPSFGVGQGNVQTIVAADYSDYDNVASIVTGNRAYDNGVPCTCDQCLHFPKAAEEQILASFQKSGAYILNDEKKIDELLTIMFQPNGAINPQNVGIPAIELARRLGIDAPEDTMILMAKARGVGRQDMLCKEKLNPVLAYMPYAAFEQGVQNAKENLLMEGAGHSAVVFTNETETASQVGAILPVSRVVVNQAGGTASGGNLCNGLNPTMSLGCGSWGNNSISENLTYRHLMNMTKVAFPIKGATFPTPEEAWAD
jgi:succinate-semialdehyde dehydrogenase